MNKKVFVTIFFAMILIFSISAINASDVNITDSDSTSSNDILSVFSDNETQIDDLKSVDLNNLSANMEDSILNENAKNRTEFTSPTTGIYYNGYFKVTLRDSNASAALANKNVRFLINNVNYEASTDSNGVASINLKLNPGKYYATVYFNEDDSYDACNLTSAFEIFSTIKAADISKYYKGTTPFTATFFDSQGNFLAGRFVTITVNGKAYSIKTNGYGVASLQMNFKPGSYRVVSTDPDTGYQVTTTFTILSTISSANLNVVKGDGKKFTVKFFKNNGAPLAKKYVKIKVKGKVRKVKTNAYGQISLSLKKFKKGTYKVVCYNKDGLSKTYTVKVFKRKASTKLTSSSYTFFANDAKVLAVKLSTALGGNSGAGRIVKIKINGKTYSKKTDGNGMAYLDLPSLNYGTYKVEYKYAGNKFFKQAKSSGLVTIIGTSDTSLTLKSTTSFGYGAGTPLKVAFTAGGVGLPNRVVTFNIAGVTYTAVTDSKGIASLPINLNIGKYTVEFKANGDDKVNGSSGSCDIEVFKRSASKLTWACGNWYKDSSQTFKVLLMGSNGQPVSGQTVELTIDSVKYQAKTNSKGYATFKTSVAFGKYKVSVKFPGSNEYLSSSHSHNVNVKLSKYGNGLNQNNAKSIGAYLKSSSHCQVGSKSIKKLVKKITKGKHSKVDKAKAIFNYVRDNLAYSYYYNSKYGATKTLKLKKGNCVDHSHLLVAMYRTAGFSARYVHGKCHFSDGDYTGHVWVQVKIGKKWVVADATSYRNSLGKIKNWNTNSYHIHSKYASVPF